MAESAELQPVWHKVSTLEELQAYRQQWLVLNQQCGGVLFCSPLWLLHWISCYWQTAWQLEVWIGIKDNQLIALLPCYSQPANNSASTRVLYPLGQGEAQECEVASEFVDLLIAPGWLHVLPALACRLQSAGRVRMTWRAAAADANIVMLCKQLGYATVQIAGYRYQHKKQQDICLSSQLKRKWHKIIRYQQNQKATFCWLTAQDALAVWPELKRLHQLRWNKRGKPGAFNCTVFNQFHLTLIAQHPETCYMSMLMIEGEVAAIHYYLQSKGYIHFYQAGWSEKYASFSPSAMLHLWSAQQTVCSVYDFMMGGTSSYKQQLCNLRETCYQLDVHPDIKSYLLAILRKLKRLTGRYKWLS